MPLSVTESDSALDRSQSARKKLLDLKAPEVFDATAAVRAELRRRAEDYDRRSAEYPEIKHEISSKTVSTRFLWFPDGVPDPRISWNPEHLRNSRNAV